MNDKTLIFTTKKVVYQSEQIITVIHDDDGEWQFLSDNPASMEDILIVTLGQILKIDSSLNEILNLERGYEAHRQVNGTWTLIKT